MISEDIDLSQSEDIWKELDDFQRHRPQSPIHLYTDLVDFNIGSDDNQPIYRADILHDCMWSGQDSGQDSAQISGCLLAQNNTQTHQIQCNSNHSLQESLLASNLSTYPLEMSFVFNEYLLSSCETSSEEIDDSQSSMDEFMSSQESITSSSSSTSGVKVMESFISDHSYIGQHNSSKTQSLIYPKHKTKKSSANIIRCQKLIGHKMTTIKAISQTISSSKTITDKPVDTIRPIPTVRVIGNPKNRNKSMKFMSYITSKDETFIEFLNQQKQCNSTLNSSQVLSKTSLISTENHICLKQENENHFKPDSEEESITESNDNSSKTLLSIKRRDFERERRSLLRDAFNNLKDEIPGLESNAKKISRNKILAEAQNYVFHLKDRQIYLEREHNREVEKSKRLLKRLAIMSAST